MPENNNTTNNTTPDVRPVCNCENLTMFKMTDDTAQTYSTTPLSFADRLTTYGSSVTTNSENLRGDGKVVDIDVTEGDGTFTAGLHHVTNAERAQLYNEKTNSAGAVISAGDEDPPFFCVALATNKKKKDGKIIKILHKWFKVKFSKHDENVDQLGDGNTNYSFVTLSGTFTANTALADSTLGTSGAKEARLEVDTSTTEGLALYNSWFTSATFVGITG